MLGELNLKVVKNVHFLQSCIHFLKKVFPFPPLYGVKLIAANKLAVGSLNAMTVTSVSFLAVRIFTQQLLEKAKFKQPTPNLVETHWYLSLHLFASLFAAMIKLLKFAFV